MRRIKRLKRKQASQFFGLFWRLILPVILLAAAVILVLLNTRYWDGKNKLAVVQASAGGDIKIFVYDPALQEIVTLIIPGDTEILVARNLGTLRLKNVWQLGINEKVGGKLLPLTIAKNFFFPVYLWRGPDGSTNVPLGDRLLLWLFERKAKNLQKSEIDLAKSQFVKKGRLADGEVGFKLPGSVSERLIVYFADNEMASQPPRVYLKDETGVGGVAEKVGRVIEVLGGKVVTIEKAKSQDLDCEVAGNFALKIARVFGCEIRKEPDLTGVDLKVTLGSKFAQRF